MAVPRTFKLEPPPHMRGEDIAEFQRDLTSRFETWGIHKRVADDKAYGPNTRDAARQICKGLGILHEVAMKSGVTPELRIKIRHIDRRTPQEIERSDSADAKEFRAHLRKEFAGPAIATVQVTSTAAGKPHWGGSNDVMTGFVEPFMVKRGLHPGSGKRTPAENDAVGGSKTSDHLTTRTLAAARDFPTSSGEDDARALAEAMGIAGWQPDSFKSFSISPVAGNDFTVQILWGAAIDHDDHVHVGITRV